MSMLFGMFNFSYCFRISLLIFISNFRKITDLRNYV